MKQGIFSLLENAPLTSAVYRMVLEGDTSAITAPGQFVNISIPGLFLRRPISVCDWAENRLTLIYKTVGRGTDALAAMAPGETLDLLTGLGNGYDLTKSGDAPLLVGGGVGVPPLYGLAKALLSQGKSVDVVLGFNTASEIFYVSEFETLGAEVHIATADGSVGTKGFVTDVMKSLPYSYFYACGPLPMFRAMEKVARTSGQYSFEERMGCGFGACVGCTMETALGPRRVCKDGPVFEREVILW